MIRHRRLQQQQLHTTSLIQYYRTIRPLSTSSSSPNRSRAPLERIQIIVAKKKVPPEQNKQLSSPSVAPGLFPQRDRSLCRCRLVGLQG